MLEAFGRRVYRRRRVVIAVWLILLAVAALFAPRITQVLHGGGYTIGRSESVDAYNALNRSYGYRALTFTAVFTGSDSTRVLASARAFRAAATGKLGRILTVAAPVWTPDRAAVFERIYSTPQEDFGSHYAVSLRALLPRGQVRGYLTGSSAIFHDMEVVSDQDLRGIELITLPVALIVLVLIFGSVVGSTVPVLMAPVSVTITLALLYWLGQRMDMSIFVLNTASMLGLGVAIDYSLFMVSRFRAELEAGSDLERAVARTVATSGRAILVSAIVVSIGFAALSLTGVSMLRSIGVGGAIVTALSLCVALTFLPAILGIMGSRINLLPVVPRRLASGGAWRQFAHWVMRHPWPVIVVVVLAVGVLALPARHLRVGIPGPQILPSSVDSRAGDDILSHHLGVLNNSPVLVVVERRPHIASRTAAGTAFAVLDRVCSSADVAGISTVPIVDSPRQLRTCSQALDQLQSTSQRAGTRIRQQAARQRVALISVFLRSSTSSPASEAYVTELRRGAPIPGYRIMIGGETAGQMDFDNYLYGRFPLVALFVICTIYVMLLLAFRSVLLPLKAVLMNVFSVLAAYGVVVWGFQDGHLSGLLGFTVVDNVDSIVPVFLFCVLFGISTDYEVFLLTRVQEEYLQTGNNEESVATSLEVTGRIITSAAAVMIVVFGAFAFARLLVIKELGLGLAAAVLVDATLIRVLLVPAAMRLLGRWNWWLPLAGFPRTGRPLEPAAGKSPAAR